MVFKVVCLLSFTLIHKWEQGINNNGLPWWLKQKTWVQFLGWEHSLEEVMAAFSIILAWRITRNRGAWWVTVRGVPKSQAPLSDFHFPLMIGV